MTTTEQEHLLRICRAAMPQAAGVVLAAPDGRVLAHDRAGDPSPLALDALARRHPDAPTSALVPGPAGLYLVVFVPPPLVEQWATRRAAA